MKDNLKKPKNNLISNLIDYNNHSKQLSFINNNLIQKKCQKELKIMDEIEDKKQKKKYPINNLINQNIKLNNNTFLSPFNMLIGSTSTKPDSNYYDSMKFNTNNVDNVITQPNKKNQSNLYYTYYGLNNNNYLNNNMIKNSTFSYSRTSTNNNNITYTNNFSKSSNLNNYINNNLINYSSHKNNIINDKKDNSEFIININDIILGKEKRTSVRIKNIPVKYTNQDFMKEIDNRMGFNKNINYRNYDLFYLPMNYSNTRNLGYAFVNFVDPICIIDFLNRFKGIKLKSNNGNKECQITFAKYQGRKEITSHLLNSSGEGKKPYLFTINKSKLRIRLPRKYAEEIKINRRDIINIIEFYDI